METPFRGKNPSALVKMYTINLHFCKGINKKKIQESIRMPSKQSSLKLALCNTGTRSPRSKQNKSGGGGGFSIRRYPL